MDISDQLFRREAGRIIAALTRIFGVHNLALAEDVTQEAFCRALEVWSVRGMPDNPSAWLMQTAKNKALDALRRARTAESSAADLSWFLQSEWTLAQAVDDLLSPAAIKDDQLRMMFSCCDPRLPEIGQVALILSILCGFSVEEVASAFVVGRAAMEKRLVRARKVLATSKHLFDVTRPADLSRRLPAVQRALYLLFNEGYHGASPVAAVRTELCREARRLTALLVADARTAVPETLALGALMCLHAARLPGRLSKSGDLLALPEQDRTLWDRELTFEGLKLLEHASVGPRLSEYHLEAAIAAAHAAARDADTTDWGAIVNLYDALLAVRPSPVLALNRVIAVAHADGPERALAELGQVADLDRLKAYPFYFAAIGWLEQARGNLDAARTQFRKALSLARNPMERRYLSERVARCAPASGAEQDGGRLRMVRSDRG
jgi:RNA polymerase sigma factor (sigma-70 family)